MAEKSRRIKMRTCKESDAECQVCGRTKERSLDIFEICFPGDKVNQMVSLCDLCTEQLFSKTLKATCYTNGRLKSNHDMEIIRRRGGRGF